MRDAQLAAFLERVFDRLGPLPGRKAFQKLLFFAQSMGWPSDFSFRLHLFGPFSEEAADQLEILEEGGAVIEMPTGGIRAGGYLGSVSQRFVVSEDAEAALTSVLDAFGGDTPLELELLATALFMWQADKRVQTHATEEGVARKVQRYKGDKFTPQQVHTAITRLRQLGVATD